MKSWILLAALALAPAAFAHVTVVPKESKPAATETYTFRVPSEGGRTTTEVTFVVPENLTIVSVAVPKDGSVSYARKAGQPDEMVWSVELKPGANAQISVTATNPSSGESVQWKVRQKYTDGTTSDWTPSTVLKAE